MTFNIENFKSNGLSLGGARPSQFEVQLSFPSSVVSTTGSSNLSQIGAVLVKAASLPSASLGTVPAFYFGRSIKLAGDRVFDPWPVSVYNDEDFFLRNAFEEWSNRINAMIDNTMDASVSSLTDLSSYKQDLVVKQYQKTGPGNSNGVVRAYKLVGAYPSVVGEIRLDWEDTNRIELFDVTWEYDYWVPTTADNISSPTYNGFTVTNNS
jgi:hypothetical protein